MADRKLIIIADDRYKNIVSEGLDIILLSALNDISGQLKQARPDMILIDAESIDKSHIEICGKIKELRSLDIPVVIISATHDHTVINDYFSVGCCDVISKPVDEKELLCRIKYHIDEDNQRKMLISENNELNLFFAAVAHDLKSPVNSLIMLTDILQDEAAELKECAIKETAEILSKKSAKVSAMIDSLMRFSKISNLIPEIEPINVELLFEDVFNDLHALDPDRNIILKSDELPLIYGDDVLIEMLIENLMSNAFKFTASREQAVIEVKYRCDESYHIISVKDNGIGFDMEDSQKVFQMFKQLNDSEEYEGNGVGLAMCYRIMTRHGGKIEAAGIPKKGAEFSLFFQK